MSGRLGALRPVFVAGIGLHAYQAVSDLPYVALALTAIRAALLDAGICWSGNEASFVGTATLGIAGGRAILKHLGPSRAPLVHLENASASGSAAFRQACIEVASGLCDVALALGVDKPSQVTHAYRTTGMPNLAEDMITLPAHFALVASEYMAAHRLKPEDVARVAVKNHANGLRNPFAQRRKTRTLEEVLHSRKVAGSLTALQCCPVGEGAAAVIVMSERALKTHDAGSRAIRVAGFATSAEMSAQRVSSDAAMTRDTVAAALDDAGIGVARLDVIELHDAFSIEELLYVEAIGLCKPGQAADALRAGDFVPGSACAVSPSGGLLAMGHPTGPTGVGQVAEIVRQLRREAEGRQQPEAAFGHAHMCGLGSVCYAHVLSRS